MWGEMTHQKTEILSLAMLARSRARPRVSGLSRYDFALAAMALRLQVVPVMSTFARFVTLGNAIDRAGFDGRFNARARQLAASRRRVRRVLKVAGLLP